MHQVTDEEIYDRGERVKKKAAGMLFLIAGTAECVLHSGHVTILGPLMLIQAVIFFYKAYRKKPYQIPDQETENRQMRKGLILFTTCLLIGGAAFGTERFLPIEITKQQVGIFQIDPFFLTILAIWCGCVSAYSYISDHKKPR